MRVTNNNIISSGHARFSMYILRPPATFVPLYIYTNNERLQQHMCVCGWVRVYMLYCTPPPRPPGRTAHGSYSRAPQGLSARSEDGLVIKGPTGSPQPESLYTGSI